MNSLFKISLLFTAVFAGLAVGLGAFAAHGLKSVLSTSALEAFKTGVNYQFLHAFALALIAILALKFEHIALKLACFLFITGTMCFSGSLYLLTLTEIHGIALVTPMGGLLFIIGWLCLGFFAIRVNQSHLIFKG